MRSSTSWYSFFADGSFCDDELTASYYGGVLASSRTPTGRDDSGKTYLALINRLSVYQIRTHFILYAITRRLFLNEQIEPAHWYLHRALVSFASYQRAMDFSADEIERFQALLEQTLFGLKQEGLLDGFGYGSGPRPTVISFAPSILGIQLYLWGVGLGNRPVKEFLDPACPCDPDPAVDITIPDDAERVTTRPDGIAER
jgi:hypothetical protein